MSSAPPSKKDSKSRNKGNHRNRGGPKFVVNADEIESRNAREAEIAKRKGKEDGSGDEDGSDASDEDAPVFRSEAEAQAAALLAAEEEQKRSRGKLKTHNPNDVKVKNIKLKDINKLAAEEPDESQMTRAERDEKEKERKKADYDKRHKEGKTEEFAKDMARLVEARKRREGLEAKKKEEEEANARAAAEALQRASFFQAGDDEEEDEANAKLDPREVKKMNPKQLKEELKNRGKPTQGNKNDLIKRLLECS